MKKESKKVARRILKLLLIDQWGENLFYWAIRSFKI